MGNCLVTKLKAVVDNDKLNEIGGFRFHVSSSGTQGSTATLQLIGSNITIKTANNVQFSVDGSYYTSYTGDNPVAVFPTDTEYDIIVKSKYNIVKINYSSLYIALDMADIAYSTNLKEIIANDTGIYGNIDVFKTCPLVELLSFYSCNKVTGDISVFSNSEHFKGANFINTKVTGDLSSLHSTPNLEVLHTYDTSISGSINDLADALAPRDGTTFIITGNGIVTYKVNGVDTPFSDQKTITFANGSYTIA